MTRINCIPPRELCDRHLLAEYRELPRVFKLARPLKNKPKKYLLGKGHVTFFYDKLLYCYQRQSQIYKECKSRGFNVKFKPFSLRSKGDKSLWNKWTPTPGAMRLNRARIRERLMRGTSP